MLHIEENDRSRYETIAPPNFPEIPEAGDTRELPRIEEDEENQEPKSPTVDDCEIGLTTEKGRVLSKILSLLLTRKFTEIKKPCEKFFI